ncbi:LytR/AlgR family response regulator transcription factor [Thermoflavifilum thermophilum]|uniref:Two component transcriptional regulator, LytTR family n=1 Tax=Thermoflavifilum thermophilum TaxID=1393122 RepID=A0A1I7MXT1_9BACT|nr:LytTR family DNA-binding domain-containing protein [Thermoflavifilum thermophilum]SFV27237.1 two component transcriptional regulator, LytTR family [Thermoflavifilum thermophilum]
MKRVIIIDDEQLARDVILEYLEDYPDCEVVAQSENGFQGLKAIQTYHPDLVFLDIQMPHLNGFEMLELCEDPPPVIFTTAYDEYAIRAFEANALDYLLKPFSRDRFQKAMEKWQRLMAQPAAFSQATMADHTLFTGSYHSPLQRIVVKKSDQIKIIPVSAIWYLEAADDYVKIHTAEGYYLKKATMQYYEDHLPTDQFVRVHRSYIVAISQISSFHFSEREGQWIRLGSGKEIPVSKQGYQKLKSVLDM